MTIYEENEKLKREVELLEKIVELQKRMELPYHPPVEIKITPRETFVPYIAYC